MLRRNALFISVFLFAVFCISAHAAETPKEKIKRYKTYQKQFMIDSGKSSVHLPKMSLDKKTRYYLVGWAWSPFKGSGVSVKTGFYQDVFLNFVIADCEAVFEKKATFGREEAKLISFPDEIFPMNQFANREDLKRLLEENRKAEGSASRVSHIPYCLILCDCSKLKSKMFFVNTVFKHMKKKIDEEQKKR